MKRVFSVLILVLIGYSSVFACDVCGCSVGGTTFGLLLQRPYHYVGLRAQYTSFAVIDEYQNNQQLQDRYWQFDLSGRFYLHERVQILASIPYHQNIRMGGDAADQEVSGLGDIQVATLGRLLDSKSENHRHLFDLGMGIHLPTGTAAPDAESLLLPQRLYPGYGSLSFSVQAAYVYQYKQWGLRALGNALLPTYGSDNYRYGRQFVFSPTLFREIQGDGWVLIPQVGWWAEWVQADEKYRDGTTVYGTGGQGHLLDAGIDWQIKQIVLSTRVQVPLGGQYAEELALPGLRSQLQLSYLF